MTTVFPSGIDSFDIRSPEEIIRARHVNDIQEAIVAIEVFALSLEETINNHIQQTTDAHDASAISVVSGPGSGLDGGSYPISANNVQDALEQIKDALDTIESINNDISAFQAHLDDDINTAHDGPLQGTNIADNSIPESKLSFDTANQAELDSHANEDVNTAHPGLITGSKIATGAISESHLDFDTATQAELNQHISAGVANPNHHTALQIEVNPAIDGYNDVQSFLEYMNSITDVHIAATTGVHGVDDSLESGSGIASSTNTQDPKLPNAVVGRLDEQRLEKKRFISDLLGTKLLLFSDTAEELEKEIFAPLVLSAGDTQLHVRNPASSRTTNISTISGSSGTEIIPVEDSSRFNVTDNITIRTYPGYTDAGAVDGYITDIPNATSVEVYIPTAYGITSNSLLTDTTIPNPLFAVESDGTVKVHSLSVADAATTDIDFDDNVIINGDLTVTEGTTLGSGGGGTHAVIGTLIITGSGNITGSFDVGAQLTTDSITSSSNISGGGNLSISGTGLISGNVTLESDLTVDDNLYIDGYAVINDAVTANSFTATTGIYNGIDLDQFHDDFLFHTSSANVGFDTSDGYFRHHTDDVGYSSNRFVTSEPKYPGHTGVLEIAEFTEPYNPSDGYLEVDTIGVLEVGDYVVIGDDGYGFDSTIHPFNSFVPTIPPYIIGGSQGRQITSIDALASPNPTITLNDDSGLDLLTLDRNARIVKQLTYNSSERDELSKVLDALAIDIHQHRLTGSPRPAHTTDQIGTLPFSFSSVFYTPQVDPRGADLQDVLDEFGTDLYHHLDGYDGYTYPHPAKDISFDNSLVNIGRQIFLTQDGYDGYNTIFLEDTTEVRIGDTLIVQDSTNQPKDVVTVIDKENELGSISFEPTLDRDYLLEFSPFVLDISIENVQEAIEALGTLNDLTNHIEDGYQAHDISAIGVNSPLATVLLPGFTASNGAEALLELAGTAWQSSMHDNLYEHLFSLEAHEAINITYDGYSPGLGPYTLEALDNVQAALDFTYKTAKDHIEDGYQAHDASTIWVDQIPISSHTSVFGSAIAPTNLQNVLEEIQENVEDGYTALQNAHIDHLADSIDAHDASAISYDGYGTGDGYIPADNVQDALDLLFRQGDEVEQVASIVNNQSTPTDITGLKFNPSTVRSAHIEYSIYRYHLTPFEEVAAVGTMRVIHRAQTGTWSWDDTRAGDNVGVTLSIDSSGQVQYTSSDLGSAAIESNIKFRARVTGA